MEDDAAVVARERVERVGVGGARVDHDRLLEFRRDREHLLEQAELRVARRVVAEPVEAGLADRDRLRMAEQLAHLGDVGVGRPAGLVRVNAEDGEDAVVRVGELEGAAAAGGRRADSEDAVDACFGGAGDDGCGIVVERVEVGVRVDHRPSRASSSSTVSGGSLRKSGRGSCSVWPGGSSLGVQEPTQVV